MVENTTSTDPDEKSTDAEAPEIENEEKEDEWLDVLGSGELKKRIIKKGNGRDTRPERGKSIIFSLKTWLEDGTVAEECDNLNIILGDSDVIQGLELILALMELGEVSEVLIPSKLAYGTTGRLPEIPANANLKCQVELSQVFETPDEDSLAFEERLKLGDQKKEKGNFWYLRQDYTQALHCYRRALDYLDNEKSSLSGPEDELQRLLEERLKVYNNMAAAQLKVNAFGAAEKSLNFVLKVQPKNVKALFRKGKVYAGNGNINNAIKIMKTALQIEPESKVIHNELAKLTKQISRERSSEKEMYRKMLGQDKVQNERSSSMVGKWSLLAGAAAAVVISYFAARHFLLSPNI